MGIALFAAPVLIGAAASVGLPLLAGSAAVGFSVGAGSNLAGQRFIEKKAWSDIDMGSIGYQE